MKMCFKGRLLTAVICGLGGITASSVHAAYTPVVPAVAPEQRTDQILNRLYGGTFAAVGANYTNGSTFATRILDTADAGGIAVPTQLGGSGASASGGPEAGNVGTTDQIWQADSVRTFARARFAVYEQFFGYVDGVTGTTGSAYHSIFDISGTGYIVQGEEEITGLNDGLFRWARSGVNARYTSQISDNPDGIDHMVTYRIDTIGAEGGLPGPGGTITTTFLLMWEDKLPNDTPDYDYNDLVVEIRAVSRVPEPASIGVFGLASLGMLRRRRI